MLAVWVGARRYEAGLRVGDRFAAIVPGGGTPFVGHNNAPPVSRNGAVSVMDLHGTSDRTCPANDTTSVDGWNYEPVDNVMKVWATAHGCSNSASMVKYNTAEDGECDPWRPCALEEYAPCGSSFFCGHSNVSNFYR